MRDMTTYFDVLCIRYIYIHFNSQYSSGPRIKTVGRNSDKNKVIVEVILFSWKGIN